MDYIANVENSEIDVSGIRTVLVQGDSSYPVIRFVLDPSLTGLSWRVRGTYTGTNIAVLSPEITAVESGTEITLDWSVSSDFTTYSGDMQLVLVGSNDTGTTVVKALADIIVQKDWSIGTVETITLNLFEQLMAQIQATEHNDFSGIQGGSSSERYHLTAAEHAVVGNTSGTNTGDQDVSGAISTHNADNGAHAGLFGAVDARLDGITNQYGNRFSRAFGERLLAAVEPSCLLLQGDSTGNDDIEWFKTSMDWLATKHPKISFEQRLWSDTHQNYSGNVSYIQTGSSGDGYIAFNGLSNNISTPDAVKLRVTGDLDVIVKYAIDNWGSNVVIPVLASKYGSAGNRGWALLMSPTRARPSLYFSTDGTAIKGGPNTTYESNADISIADGSAIWIRCTFDVDNGSGGCDLKFYTSSDGATWTQLGTTVTNSGTTSIYASTAPLMCGTRETSGTYLAGKFYRMILRNGINGKIVASPSAGLAHPLGTTTMKDAEENTWTLSGNVGGSPLCICLNASKPGAAVNYSADVTRFALQTPIEPQLAFVSYSHNEGIKTAYQSEYSALLTQILTKFSGAGVVCVTQNPQKSPMTTAEVNAHASRNRQIALVAAINNYGLVDAYRAFVKAGSDALIESDGVHPTAAGDIVWRDAAIQFLLAATLD